MRRIYYFSIYKYFFRYLRNYHSVTIQLLRYKTLVDQWTMFLISIKHIGHTSTYSISRDNSTRQTPPGRKKTFSKRCTIWLYVCLPINKFSLAPKLTPTTSVEMAGFEPATFALQRRCSPTELHPQEFLGLVGLTGFEPVTPVLSGLCSNQLSYKPVVL